MELVVGPDLLQLTVRMHQRLPVPQPDIVNGRLVGLKRLEGEALLYREGFDRDLMEIIRLLGKVDVPLNVRASPAAVRSVSRRRAETARGTAKPAPKSCQKPPPPRLSEV